MTKALLPQRRTYGLTLSLVLSVLAINSQPVLADGGSSIASAPTVTYGQQEFGNTATDGANANPAGVFGGCDNGPNYESLWNLAVSAGDRVTVDYEGDIAGLFLYPVGTTDFNVGAANHLESDANNGRGELAFSVPTTGLLPLNFFTGCASTGPGPYSFTAYVRHGLRLALPNHWGKTNTLRVAVHNPVGEAIPNGSGLRVSIQVRYTSSWVTVGSAGVTHSTAAVHFNIPHRYHGRQVKLRVIAQGANYLTATTTPVTVEVT